MEKSLTAGFTLVSYKDQGLAHKQREGRTIGNAIELDIGSMYCRFSNEDTFLKDWQYYSRETYQDREHHLACFGFPVFPHPRTRILDFLSKRQALHDAGRFAVVSATDSAIEIAADYFGIFPVFYSQGPRGVAVSNNMPMAVLMAGNPLEFDRDHVLEWIITEGNLGFDESLRYVKRLSGDELLRLEPGGRLTIIPLSPANRDTPAEVEWLAESLKEDLSYVANHAHKLYCKLSGGYDSRVNFALLRHAQIPFECFTEHHPSPDTEIARKIGEDYAQPHRFNEIREGENAIFVTGLCGHIGFYYRNSRGFQNPEKDLLQHYLPAKKLALCGSAANRNVLIERAQSELRSIKERPSVKDDDPYYALDLFYLNRIRTWAGRSLASPNNASFCSLINPKYFAFYRHYTAQWRARRQVHLDLLNYCDPKLATYPFFSIPQSTKGKIFDQLPLSAQTAVMRAINARKNPTVEIPTDTLLLDIFTEDEVGRLLTVNASVKRSTESFLAFEESVKNYMAAPPSL